jgi:hypothetical protein
VAIYYPLYSSQPYASAFKRFLPVKTLEYAKQLMHVLHIKTDSIVSNEDDYLILSAVGATDLNLCFGARAREFNGVGEKIDQYKSQH